jgi:phosphopantothenoylcysteine synthetase/decarboxylase
MKDKNLDIIVANSPAAIGSDNSSVQIKPLDSPWSKIERATKTTIAKRIIRLIDNYVS